MTKLRVFNFTSAIGCCMICFICFRNHDLSDWDVYADIHAIIDQGVNGSVDEEVLLFYFQLNQKKLNVPSRC